MHEIRISSRYAESVLELAQEQNVADQLKADMVLFKETYEGSRELRVMLKNPIISTGKKNSVLTALFGSKMQELTARFFALICRKNREGLLYDIALEVIALYNKQAGVVSAQVRTALPLSDTLRAEFVRASEKISGMRVELEEKVDPEVIGGFVLRVGDRQIDSSIQSSLRQLQNSFLNANA